MLGYLPLVLISVLVVELDLRLWMPRVVLAPETLFTKAMAAAGHVQAEDRRFAYQLIDARMMEYPLGMPKTASGARSARSSRPSTSYGAVDGSGSCAGRCSGTRAGDAVRLGPGVTRVTRTSAGRQPAMVTG